MSHVVENALRDDDECREVLLDFQRSIRKSTPSQLSEMAAYFMMKSPAVAELFSRAYGFTSKRTFEPSEPDWIADIIVGRKIDDEFPLLQELISGPFDADKLDYMPRDAKMCGVPVVTDVVRLVQKVRAVPVRSEKLPDEIGGVQALERGHVLIGVARSGASALDEVSLSRSLMFDKIYRHHKVRAVESMVGSIVELIAPLLDSKSARIPLSITDEKFLDLDRAELDRRNAGLTVSIDENRLRVALDILDRLGSRRLFIRSFAFAQTMPFDAYKNDPELRVANEKFIRELSQNEDPVPVRVFFDKVIGTLRRAAELAHREADLENLTDEDLRAYIRIDPPSSGRGAESDQSRAFLVDEDGNLFKVEKVRAENRGWADAYVNTKDVGFVFAPREFADLVHISVEVAARELYGVRIPKEMRAYSKFGGKRMRDLREALNLAGFYKELSRDLRPTPAFLTEVGTTGTIRQALAGLAGYMGPAEVPDATSTLNETKVTDWIGQFDEDLQPLALKVISSVRMLSRDDGIKALRNFIGSNPSFSQASVVALGDPKDGSSIVGYHAGDLSEELGLNVRNLDGALGRVDPIIFVDDIIGRGSSAISIFESLTGSEQTQRLGEERDEPLPDAMIQNLRERQIAVVFTAGFDAGVVALRARLASIGLNATVYADQPESTLPTLGGALSEKSVEDSLRERFVAQCTSVGIAILEDDDVRHDDAWRRERALGYGNLGLLVISSYNTPTASLTALWRSSSRGRSVQWRAVMPRRKKK
ncbi:hypothetical protein ASE64_15265 [Agreia sp. Leaf210]|nr:hypothetical protein ASE64_15265 [Agreia sp. Leaf210]